MSTLFLIPSTLGAENVSLFLPAGTIEVVHSLKHFVVEDAKTARAFLKSCGIPTPQAELDIRVLDKHQPDQDLKALLQGLSDGNDVGVLSEAGCPGVADPGAKLVAEAYRMGHRVKPLTGPSSLLLALMASGLEGQRFCFHGYLPIDKQERMKKMQRIEEASRSRQETQLFIEAPYRNNQLLADLLQHLSGETKLCIAVDLTLSSEFIRTLRVREWKKQVPELHKRPTVFLIGH